MVGGWVCNGEGWFAVKVERILFVDTNVQSIWMVHKQLWSPMAMYRLMIFQEKKS